MTRQSMLALAFDILLAVIVTVFCVATAFAHSDGAMTYDADCCSGQDCAPVIRAQLMPPAIRAGMTAGPQSLPVLWVETIHGKAPVLSSAKRRESKDGRMHACILLGSVICVYEAPAH